MDIVYLINKIKKLSIKEKGHILTILTKNNVPFTKNLNGYFFNLININENVYEKINKCVDLIERNRELIESLEKKRELHIEYYKTLIENKLNERLNLKKKDYYNMIIIKDTYDLKIIKKRDQVSVQPYIDPDILIKNYLKRFKYEKGTLYYKLNQIISKRKKKVVYTSNEDNGYSVLDMESNYGSNLDDIEDINDIDEIEDINQDDESFYNDNPEFEDNENIQMDDDDNIDEDMDNLYDQTNNENEHDIDNELENDNMIDELLQIESKVEFYKNLLKMDGFIFDEDKNVKMKLQEYLK